jgi:hypothetical protein
MPELSRTLAIILLAIIVAGIILGLATDIGLSGFIIAAIARPRLDRDGYERTSPRRLTLQSRIPNPQQPVRGYPAPGVSGPTRRPFASLRGRGSH